MKNTLKIITKVGADQAKGLSEKQIETLTSKGYNLWTTDDGKHDRLYLDVYNHEGMLHYGEWDGEEIFPAEQRARYGSMPRLAKLLPSQCALTGMLLIISNSWLML